MPRSHGKQKRAQKQKKRREAKRRTRPSSKRVGAEAREAVDLPDLRERCGYDANHAPQAESWLALDEKEQMERIKRYHLTALSAANQPPSLPRHAGLHAAVENQLATDKPAQVKQALLRLMRQGMTRHDAIHAVGSVMMKHMQTAIDNRRAVDNKAYMHDLEQLSLESWLASMGKG